VTEITEISLSWDEIPKDCIEVIGVCQGAIGVPTSGRSAFLFGFFGSRRPWVESPMAITSDAADRDRGVLSLHRNRLRTVWWQRPASITLLLGLALGWAGAPAPARAEAAPSRWLRSLDIEPHDTGWTIELRFGAPLVLLSHSPRHEGRLVEISMAPAASRDRSRDVFEQEERTKPPRDSLSPLREVKLEPQGTGHAMLVLSFSRKVRFELRPESGGRALVIQIQAPTDGSDVATTSPAAASNDVEAVMAEARRSMTVREYDRAIGLYTKVLSMPAGRDLPEAQEYLGLARQKNGQRAHARAEYELYLLRFPDSEGTARVQQRLDALLSSAQTDRAPLRAGRGATPTLYTGYGVVSTSYQRAESFADLSGAVMLDSSQIIDLDVTGLMRGDRFEARARGSGYYRYDFLDSDTGRGSRIRYLNLDLRDRNLRLRGVLGRQSARGGGILGRFDGASASWSFGEHAYLGGAFGFPQDSALSNSIDTSRAFVEMRVGVEGWRDQLSGEIWGVGQTVDGLTDRIALGYELRWLGRLGSAFSAMDVDVYHGSLNLIMASGSVELIEGTSLNLLADYRRAPYLTTRNALIGQGVSSIDALRQQFSTSQIEDLARARTPTSATFMIGIDQRLGPRWRLTGDFTATNLSATPAAGGVAATPSTGWDFFYLAQIVGADLLTDGDSGRAFFRVFDGFRYVGYTLGTSARIPVLPFFWLSPRLDLDYRDHEELSGRLTLRPGLRGEYRFEFITLEADLRLEWLRSVGSGVPQPNTDVFGYLFDLTVRWDF
jgi:hypothetical protein